MSTTEELNERKNALLFGVRRSIRYHNRRRQFFDRLHKVTNGIGVICGSAAIFTAIEKVSSIYTVIAGVLIAVSSALDLVIGTAQMARLHTDLAKRFVDLEKAIVVAGDYSEEELRKFTADRLDIEADEPPKLHVLDVICHNDLMRAMGYGKEEMVKIDPLQRIFSPFFDFKEHQIGH